MLPRRRAHFIGEHGDFVHDNEPFGRTLLAREASRRESALLAEQGSSDQAHGEEGQPAPAPSSELANAAEEMRVLGDLAELAREGTLAFERATAAPGSDSTWSSRVRASLARSRLAAWAARFREEETEASRARQAAQHLEASFSRLQGRFKVGLNERNGGSTASLGAFAGVGLSESEDGYLLGPDGDSAEGAVERALREGMSQTAREQAARGSVRALQGRGSAIEGQLAALSPGESAWSFWLVAQEALNGRERVESDALEKVSSAVRAILKPSGRYGCHRPWLA